MRIWLSGGRGFTGRGLSQVLKARGETVLSSELDLRNYQAVRDEISGFQPDAIIHLAAISQPTHHPANDFYDVNVLGTEAILLAASELPSLKRVIVASSATVYGRLAQEAPVLSEEMVPKPVGHYAISKFSMEQMVWSFEDVPTLVVRPFNYTGRGQSDAFLLGKVASLIRQRARRIELGALDLARDFTSLSEVLRVYVRCVDQCAVHQGVLNICSGHAQSLSVLVGCLIEESGLEVDITISDQLKRGPEIKTLCGDTTRLREWIGYVPKPLDRVDLQHMLSSNE